MKTLRSLLAVSTVILATTVLRADSGMGSSRREYFSPTGGSPIATGNPSSIRRSDDRREYRSPTSEVTPVATQPATSRSDDRREYHSPH